MNKEDPEVIFKALRDFKYFWTGGGRSAAEFVYRIQVLPVQFEDLNI
jgi:hypothetical protein